MNDRINKINALRAKAVDNAATEAEAMEAMEMANKLMEKWQISEDDLRKVRAEDFIKGEHENVLKTMHPVVKWLAKTVSEFCECKAWWDKHQNKLFFFGLEQDVRMAEYLVDMLRTSMEADWRVYLKSPDRERGISNHKLYWSFMGGWTDRVYKKFRELIEARQPVTMSDGTALIVLKSQLVEEELAKLIRLKKARKANISMSGSAYASGTVAGDKLNLNRPIGHARQNAGQKRLA